MRCYTNHGEFEIPVDTDGHINSDHIRRAARIPPDRVLIAKRRDGSNEVINPGERIRPNSDVQFADMPLSEQGDNP